MSKVDPRLEKAVLDLAMRDSQFRRQLRQDPFGFLKSLAAGEYPDAIRPRQALEAEEGLVHFTRVRSSLKPLS